MIPYDGIIDFAGEEPNIIKPIGGGYITYEQFVCTLVKELHSAQHNLTHMAVGISGEAGELLDAVKKYWVYNKPLDRDNAIEELGDLEFYMAGMRQMLGVSRKDILAANVEKLSERYQGAYSDQAAIDRADKKPAPELQIIDVTKEQVRAMDSQAGVLK